MLTGRVTWIKLIIITLIITYTIHTPKYKALFTLAYIDYKCGIIKFKIFCINFVFGNVVLNYNNSCAGDFKEDSTGRRAAAVFL